MSTSPCWQYLVKKERKQTHEGRVPCQNWDDIQVVRLLFKQAKTFILDYEWLGNIGAATFCYGLFIEGHLACVTCYGPPVSPKAYFRVLGARISRALLQLCRGASAYWAPKWTPSKLIAHSLKLLSIETNAKAVVAYADPQAGEIGTIYQACNAIYIGMTDSGGARRYVINGESYHPRTVYRKFGSRSKDRLLVIDPNFKVLPIHPKHRYIFPMGSRANKKEILRRVEPLRQAYPKRPSHSEAKVIKHAYYLRDADSDGVNV